MNSINSCLPRLFLEARLQGWSRSGMPRPRTQKLELRWYKAPSVSKADSFPYRNHEIPIFLKRGFNRALRFGISDSHTFARRCAPSNVVLCLSRGRHATRCFKPTIYTYNCLTDWGVPSLRREEKFIDICRKHWILEAVPAKALFGPAGIDQREMQAGRQNGEQRWRCQLGRKGSYFHQESYYESVSTCCDKIGFLISSF